MKVLDCLLVRTRAQVLYVAYFAECQYIICDIAAECLWS